MRLGVAFQTLGCKLNQLETDALVDSFKIEGASILPLRGGRAAGRVDLFVLNTCTVTGKAEQKARHAARAVLAEHPRAVVLVTGCYAQLDGEGLESIHERIVAVPGENKDAILVLSHWLEEHWNGRGDLLDAVREWKAESRPPDEGGDRFAFNPGYFALHSRPALKVQDGCDNRCAYCRVRLARGASRSLPAATALARARSLEAAHKAEIVLTGVNLSQYRDGSMRFPGLVAALLEGTTGAAFRISSYEPDRIDEAFLSIFARDRVRPHAHLPVQSGADPVLAAMGRGYRRDLVLAAIEALRRVKGDPFLAADIIVGFPGETDEDFSATLELCRTAGFAWIHAFPFSPRPGTRAFEFRPRVPERVAGERAAELGALARGTFGLRRTLDGGGCRGRARGRGSERSDRYPAARYLGQLPQAANRRRSAGSPLRQSGLLPHSRHLTIPRNGPGCARAVSPTGFRPRSIARSPGSCFERRFDSENLGDRDCEPIIH